MKTHFKLSTSGTVTLVLAFSILPLNAFAVSSQTTTTPTVAKGFCANLSADDTKISTGIDSRTASLDQNRAKSAAKLQAERASVDAEVVSDRAKWDATRQQDFNAIEAKATTAAEKTAVSTFEQTVLADVNTRRNGVDQARTTFRSGEDALIASRQSQVNSYVSIFENAVDQTESTAQASCNAGTTPSTVRTTFVASLKDARTSYQTSVAAVPTIKSALASLVTARDDSINSTDATFKAAVQQAANTLKSVLHQ